MTWYGWYSAKEENMYGYAHYQTKKGFGVCITKISQDPNFKHDYKDSVYHGELTHFIGIKQWNGIKRNRKAARDNILSTMTHEPCVKIGDPQKITN